MDEREAAQNDGFILLPAASGGSALVRRSQIAGARANGRDGAIVYAKCGPSIYTTATVSQLAFDHRIHVVEISETSRSLEEILLDMTGATAEYASA